MTSGASNVGYLLRLFLALIAAIIFHHPAVCQEQLEEFPVYGPQDLNNYAMNAFLDLKKVEPDADMEYNGTFMTTARSHAIRRNALKPDSELRTLTMAGAIGGTGELNEGGNDVVTLSLPAPEDQATSHLVAATNSGNAGSLQLRPEENKARAMEFTETVGVGAISRTGALVMGSDGSWMKFAEDKIHREAQLDYQQLMWEYGTGVAEKMHNERKGLNVSMENELLTKMKEWFIAGGGRLNFAEPKVDPIEGIKLFATEDIHASDTIMSVPLKLVMCRQTARNVLIHKRGKYLGDELAKTFEKDEVMGMVIFLLHEYYKEINGNGSKWGPFLRTLRMRFLSTDVHQAIKGTTASQMLKRWFKITDNFVWWTSGQEGPCTVTTGICRTKPNDNHGDTRYSMHQIRWAYWVVRQNAVRVRHVATGLEFIALVPFYNMLEKRVDGERRGGGGITFDLDGSVTVRAWETFEDGMPLSVNVGNLTDAEFFLKYFSSPKEFNANNYIKMSLPGALPKGSKFHFCMKGTDRQRRSDQCQGAYKSESLFWRSKVLGEWRQMMNLPPRLQELRMWAMRLHLYGSDEETRLLNHANKLIAGLPIPVEQMPAEEQLMLMGVAKTNDEAQLMVVGADKPPPQLYSAPDYNEDYEALKAMENLAFLAVQAQNVVASGNVLLNATQIVLNQTRDFFSHGILPQAGLDALDEFLLKKIGMISHCGFENNMKITYGNVSDELMCAMRVHLMNESEIHIFCPKEVRAWEESCHNVEFSNFTAISESNELGVINAMRKSIKSLLSTYVTTVEEDEEILSMQTNKQHDKLGSIMLGAVKMRLREKQLLHSAIAYMDEREEAVKNGSVVFQIELKARERVEASRREEQYQLYLEEVRRKAAAQRSSLASVEVDMGPDKPKVNLTIEEGQDLKEVVLTFCRNYGITSNNDINALITSLQKRVISPPPLALFLGVVTPLGERRILAIPEHSNSTIETSVFCAKHNITLERGCQDLQKRVNQRLAEIDASFVRRILTILPINAPDTRKLQLIVREGEQHDLPQFVADFFTLYGLSMNNVRVVVDEINKRLPPPALSIPVNLPNRRKVVARFAENDNITAVVEGFINFFEIDEGSKIQILKLARGGMAPGTFIM